MKEEVLASNEPLNKKTRVKKRLQFDLEDEISEDPSEYR